MLHPFFSSFPFTLFFHFYSLFLSYLSLSSAPTFLPSSFYFFFPSFFPCLPLPYHLLPFSPLPSSFSRLSFLPFLLTVSFPPSLIPYSLFISPIYSFLPFLIFLLIYFHTFLPQSFAPPFLPYFLPSLSSYCFSPFSLLFYSLLIIAIYSFLLPFNFPSQLLLLPLTPLVSFSPYLILWFFFFLTYIFFRFPLLYSFYLHWFPLSFLFLSLSFSLLFCHLAVRSFHFTLTSLYFIFHGWHLCTSSLLVFLQWYLQRC